MALHPGITVIDCFRERGVETEKEKTWSVGVKAQHRYRQTYGCEPPKDLRTKTCGVGVHCFAIYPLEFKPTIMQLIEESAAEEARQSSLFL